MRIRSIAALAALALAGGAAAAAPAANAAQPQTRFTGLTLSAPFIGGIGQNITLSFTESPIQGRVSYQVQMSGTETVTAGTYCSPSATATVTVPVFATVTQLGPYQAQQRAVSVAGALVQPDPWNDARSALVAATGCTSLYTISATTTQTATITDNRGHSAQASVTGSWP